MHKQKRRHANKNKHKQKPNADDLVKALAHGPRGGLQYKKKEGMLVENFEIDP